MACHDRVRAPHLEVSSMRVVRAYTTELDLNNAQVTACKRHAGTARYAYNWGLARKLEAYLAAGKSPSAIDLHRELNALKQTQLRWMYDVSTEVDTEQ